MKKKSHCINNTYILSVLFIVLIIVFQPYAAPYKNLIPGYKRSSMPVMARFIDAPTRAHLDFCAYYDNPIRYNPESEKPKPPAKKPLLAEISFGNTVKNVCTSLQKTPLTPVELEQPYAIDPVANEIWKELKSDFFNRVNNKIKGEKWADPDIFKPYQEIAALYLHNEQGAYQFWIEIELSPWVTFIKDARDTDKDGCAELFCRINTDSLDAKTMAGIVLFLTGDYTKKILTHEEIVDWANQLASYWYPTLNTDIVALNNDTLWPTNETEPEIKKALKKTTIKHPSVVIKGNPSGKVLYNVFVTGQPLLPIAGISSEKNSATPVTPPVFFDTAFSSAFKDNNHRFSLETESFGAYDLWHRKNKPCFDRIAQKLSLLPREQMGIRGIDSWLFFRKSFDYILGKDITAQSADKNPLPALIAFKKYLDAHHINLLFIPVPNKEEVYFEKIDTLFPQPEGSILNPYSRKFLLDVQKAGIEVVDLLPFFLKAKTEDGKNEEFLFQRHDTHWTSRGLLIAGTIIADRIKQYAWFPSYNNQLIKYSFFDTTFVRTGDIVDRLSEQDKALYEPVQLRGTQVITPQAKKYTPVRGAPILLIGDSFTGVFESIDCKSAGIGSHIAAETGLPVDIVTSWGGGPPVRNKMIRTVKDQLKNATLVIYMMTARDLYDYAAGWEKLQIK